MQKDQQPVARVIKRIDEDLAKAAFSQALESYNQDFDGFFLSKFLGLEISYTDNSCVIDVEVRDYMFNPQGSLHGGLISTILDISMGHLLHRHSGAGVTLEMKVQFLRPIRQGRVHAQASFIRQGRSICYLEAKITDSSGRIAAVATSTFQLLSANGA